MESAPVISNNHVAAQKIIIDTDPSIYSGAEAREDQGGHGPTWDFGKFLGAWEVLGGMRE